MKIDEFLEQLDTLKLGSDNTNDLLLVQKALKHTNNRVVAKAAQVCRNHALYPLTNTIAEAFLRLLKIPLKDKNCIAKNAICEALVELDHKDEELYLQGLNYRQMEPVWEGVIDTATTVRSHCAMGMSFCSSPRVLTYLIEALNDPEIPVRIGAVQAITNTQPEMAEIVLRTKVLSGDEEPDVVAECFQSLLAIEPDYSLEFVARYLDYQQPEIMEYAALSLGTSNLPESFEYLLTAWNQPEIDQEYFRIIVRSMVFVRTKESFNFLYQVIDDNLHQLACTTVELLSIYKENDVLKNKIKNIVQANHYPALLRVYEEFWQ